MVPPNSAHTYIRDVEMVGIDFRSVAVHSDACYVASIKAINERIENPLFFANFWTGVCMVFSTLAFLALIGACLLC